MAYFADFADVTGQGRIGYTTWTFWPAAPNVQLWEAIENVWVGELTVDDYLAEQQALWDTAREEGNVLPFRLLPGSSDCWFRQERWGMLCPIFSGNRVNGERLERENGKFNSRSFVRSDGCSTIDAPRAKAHSRWRGLGRWMFIVPLLLLNLTVIVGPSVAGLAVAFTDWSGIGAMQFIGLANFRRLIQDPMFFKALTNNLIWTLIFLTVPVSLGLLGAYMLTGVKRGQMVLRVTYFIPYVMAAVVNAQLWRFLMHPRAGLGPWLAQYGITFLDIPGLGPGPPRSTLWHSWTTGISGVFCW